MHHKILFDDGHIQWVYMGRDPNKPDSVIDTNEYMIISGEEAMILDPGGTEIFPSVLTKVSQLTELKRIKAYLCSHQDPDILSSLPLWMGLTPNAKVFVSWLWAGFISHFGNEYSSNFEPLEDEGKTIELGGKTFKFVPAHHCHSAGNFHFFDPTSKILFTGDLGAALLPPDYGMIVEDFDEYIQYMEAFHLRWMPSNEAKQIWINRVRKLNPSMLCPQHGAIFKGENVEKFLDWLEDLEVGKLKKSA